ncbi:N-acetylmuramoyl-L-alanine amidase [Pontibacillus halophilus JSM 076056 = DSM 19796]|uniref:N-acetylmuramoyl-L-alanine amidase n=1 Tax=Pontibacillus halophilus JSM 076056 = DSM 19796 TaxID=1385510 RepID=A0A0A5GEA8_9BACI|nr:N-acetylmuramoyl-L-alanine amidase CwlD [Pontibacillus halophilus]KGX90354.1 N-acetylmuramoyl-L-alanine amidase [Pontibacillus halophilus JSM 076056 = DSM 19796]
MRKPVKIISWLLGFVLLIALLSYPLPVYNTWQTWSLPLTGKTIVLDPGHGGVDGGAVGSDETLEKDIALQVTKQLRDYLQQAGALVYLTREEDVDLADKEVKSLSSRKSQDIRRRVEYIKKKDPDLYLSVHLNALPSSKWSGAQSFFYPSSTQNELLAKSIQHEIRRNLENTNREALAIDHVYLLKHAPATGALVEIGFLSNTHERDLLKTESYQKKVAFSIYEGILSYVVDDERTIPEN